MASLKQLANKRIARGIPRRELAERMNCSPQWVRWLENANTTRPTADLWRVRYEDALREALVDQEELIRTGGKLEQG